MEKAGAAVHEGRPWGQLCPSAPAQCQGSAAEPRLWQRVGLHELMDLSYAAFSIQGVPFAQQKHDMAQSKSPYSVLICWNSSIWQLQRRKEQKNATAD